MIPKVIYTADLSESPDRQRLAAWKHAWQTLHPEWDVVTFTLETRPPILNHDQWQQTLDLSEPAASAARLNLLRYEVLAREGVTDVAVYEAGPALEVRARTASLAGAERLVRELVAR